MSSFFERAIDYAQGIIDGQIPAGLEARQSCQRFIGDLQRALAEDDGIWFDPEAVEKKCRKLEQLPHVKGKWAAQGKLLELSPWQIFVSANIFGFKKIKNGKKVNIRRFREAYIEVPRKNGKTFFIAGIGLILLADDGEFGAEVYCGATSEKQALEVFTPAKQIVQRDADFREHFGVEANAKNLVIPSNGSKFEPIIGDPGDGASPSCAIADEYHEHKDSDQVETMKTGMGAREQPIMLIITTAGSDMGGPCYATRSEVKDILDGTVRDDSVFGIIFTIDEGDAWDTIEAQIKANPNYGISVNEDYLQGQLAGAKRSATKQNSYKTKHLNQWVGAKTAWLNMLAYQACVKKNLDIEKFVGQQCYVGIDLSSKFDVASMAVVFPPCEVCRDYAVFCTHYLPEEKATGESAPKRYKSWHTDGYLTLTPGEVIDFGYIETDLLELKSKFEVIEVPYDPYQATQFATRMMDEDMPMVEFGQNYKNFSEPMQELEAVITKKNVQFAHDPVLRWMFGNVVAFALNGNGDVIKPGKEAAANKIDGAVATLMGFGRAIFNIPEEDPYAKRGLRVL